MQRFPRIVVARLLAAGLCVLVAFHAAVAQTSVRTVKVLGGKDTVEIEIEASEKLVPQTQVLAGPDRLVIDFPNATPGSQLRSQSVNLGEVKDMRIGLFQAKPPVTRVVLDLKTAQSFQVFPYGRTTIIKVTGAAGAEPDSSAAASDFAPESVRRPGLVVANYTNRAEPIRVERTTDAVLTNTDRINASPINSASANAAAAKPALEVTFRDGLLAIRSDKATLSEVLYAVQQRTGAEVSISAGAEQERVVVDVGPGPAPEILAQLLNGSKFNFLILNAANDPRRLDRVILTPRPERVNSPVAQNVSPVDEDTPAQPQPARAPARVAPAPAMPGSQGEGKPVDDTTPEQ